MTVSVHTQGEARATGRALVDGKTPATNPLSFYTSGKGLRTRMHLPGKYIVVLGILPAILLIALISGYLLHNNRYESLVPLEEYANAHGIQQTYYPLPELIVDLSPDFRGHIKYLKVKPAIAIPISNRDDIVRTLDTQRSLITERVTLFLRILRPEDFQTTEQMNRIKQELTRRINLGAGSDVAQDVVLEQLVIQ